MKARTPLVSVLMPAYNSEVYIEDAVGSILNQTFSNFELIVVDDCSTDGTLDKLYNIKDERLKIIKNEENRGVAHCLNLALDKSVGKFVARMDADDISEPTRIEKQLAWLVQNPGFGVVATEIGYIDHESRLILNKKKEKRINEHLKISISLPFANCIAHPSVMCDGNLIRSFRYNTDVKNAEDYELWLRFLASGVRFYKIDEVLLRHRIHNQSVTSVSNAKELGSLEKNLGVYQEFLKYKGGGKQLVMIRVLVILSFMHKKLKVFIYNRKKKYIEILKNIIFYFGKVYGEHFLSFEKCKVLMVFPHYHVGGAEKVHLDVLNGMIHLNPVVVFTYKSNDKKYFEDFKRRARVYEFKALRFKVFYFFYLSMLEAWIKKNNTAMCLIGSNNSFYYDLIKRLPQSCLKIDILHALDNEVEKYSNQFIIYLNKRLVINPLVKKNLIKRYKKMGLSDLYSERIVLIENKIAQSMLREKNNFRDKMKVFYIGRGAPEKRIDLIYKAAELCKNRMINISVELVGPGVEKFLPENYKEICKIGKVFYKENDLLAILDEADVLLMTSSTEGFPVVVMEAMARGVIPVLTNVGGVSAHIHNGYNGFLIEDTGCEQKIVKDVVDIIDGLSINKNERMKVSLSCYNYAAKHFVMDETTSSQYLSLLQGGGE